MKRIIVHGKSECEKNFLIERKEKYVIERLDYDFIELLALTGFAAGNTKGQTLHLFLKFQKICMLYKHEKLKGNSRLQSREKISLLRCPSLVCRF